MECTNAVVLVWVCLKGDNMTFLKLAEKVLRINGKPMTSREIWNYAKEKGFDAELNCAKSGASTPVNSLSTLLLNAEKKPNSSIVLVSSSPKKYYLKGEMYNDTSSSLFSEDNIINIESNSMTTDSVVPANMHIYKNKHYVYILTNPSFPKFVKIGYSKDVESRLKSLNTATPYRFQLYAAFEVYEKDLDKKIHGLIDAIQPDFRAHETINGRECKSEFYAFTPEKAYDIIEKILAVSNVKTIQQDNRGTGRNKRISFKKLNLIGEELEFYNDPSIKVKVRDDRTVIYKGKLYSLSKLYCVITGENKSIQGPKYFRYKGELLTDLRARLGV